MRPLQHLLASNLLVPQNESFEHSRLEELDSTKFSHKERWQSGRMRVFAKDVTGQKLVHGFESRPLRQFKLVFVGGLGDDSLQAGATIFIHGFDFTDTAVV